MEMLYEISDLLNVTADALLNEEEWRSRGISYQKSGLDTAQMKEPVYSCIICVPFM